MGTTYTATINFTCWKQHACVNCGSQYSYMFKRTKKGQASTESGARAACQNAVVKALTKEVDMQPCPGCGLYQPDMVGDQRARRHLWLLVAAAIGLVLLLILAASEAMSRDMVCWSAFVLCAGVFAGHVLVDMQDPNKDLMANQKQAQAAVDRGILKLGPAPDQTEPSQGAPSLKGGVTHTMLLFLFSVAVVWLIVPEVMRTLNGWTFNPGWHPPVAGPGDTPYIYFGKKVTSIKGMWAGRGTAQILNAAELGVPDGLITISSNGSSWGSTISVKSSEKSNTSTLWAKIHIPPRADLAGKKLRLMLHLDVTYPGLAAGNSWNEMQDSADERVEIQLASTGAGSVYNSAFWGALWIGGGTVLLLGFILSRMAAGLRALARPTSVIPFDEG